MGDMVTAFMEQMESAAMEHEAFAAALENTDELEEVQALYLASGGIRCLHCGSEEVNSGGFETKEPGSIYENRYCDACGESWDDIYKLVAIDLDEDDDNQPTVVSDR